jgi:hypothetical protein
MSDPTPNDVRAALTVLSHLTGRPASADYSNTSLAYLSIPTADGRVIVIGPEGVGEYASETDLTDGAAPTAGISFDD